MARLASHTAGCSRDALDLENLLPRQALPMVGKGECWKLAGGLSFHPRGSLCQATYDLAAQFPRVSKPRGSKAEVFCDPASEDVTLLCGCNILWTMRGGEDCLRSSMGPSWRLCVTASLTESASNGFAGSKPTPLR